MVRMQWMDPARPRAALRDLEPPALAQQQVTLDGRDADVLQRVDADFHVAVRRVVIAVDGQRALDGHPLASSGMRIIDCCWCLRASHGVGLAHQDRDLAARIAGPARPPFAAVDDIVVAVADDAAFDVGRVGRSDPGLGHQERRADFAAHQGGEPLLLLLARAVAVEHFHVAGVGRTFDVFLRTGRVAKVHDVWGLAGQMKKTRGNRRVAGV
jgi:hypothetical protein